MQSKQRSSKRVPGALMGPLHSSARSVQTGYTLIELMIVVIILGILLSLGLPAYQNSIIRSNRYVGRGILTEVVSRQEQYFINNKSYAGDLTELGYVADPFYVDGQADAYSSSVNSIYQIDLALATGIYTVTATAVNRQLKDALCGNFTLTSRGVKGVSVAGNNSECW